MLSGKAERALLGLVWLVALAEVSSTETIHARCSGLWGTVKCSHARLGLGK